MSKLGQITTTSFIDWNDFISLITRLENDKEYKFCLLISIGVFTGVRISDLLTLKFSHILNEDVFLLTEKKTKKDRSIKVNSTLKNIVQRVYNKSGVSNLDEFIFLNKYGTKCGYNMHTCNYLEQECVRTKYKNKLNILERYSLT